MPHIGRKGQRKPGRIIVILWIAVMAVAGCTAAVGSVGTSGRATPSVAQGNGTAGIPAGVVSSNGATARGGKAGSAGPVHPNIVFVLTDDLSTNLVRYMPHVLGLERAGMTFTNYSVADSLCCPSRSTIFTGQFPHNTGVYANDGPYGGFGQFLRRGDSRNTFAVALQSAGYRTAMMGKYLNGYFPSQAYSSNGTALTAAQNPQKLNYVAPGWSTWDVMGNGYVEYDYLINENHKIVKHGLKPSDFGVSVLQGLGVSFVADSAQAHKPFMLEVATFAPHLPYTMAPQDKNKFLDVVAPRDPAFNKLPQNAPRWLAKKQPLNARQISQIDVAFRDRVQAVQSVDRMIGALEDELQRTGQARNTVFVFSSDNGLHMGEYRFMPGKLTAYDIDVNVPLIVAGPGIAHGSVNPAVVQNTDLAPTFEAIAGLRPSPSIDGRSLLPLLHSQKVTWRATALTEHLGLDMFANDPDFQDPDQANPPSYEALRTATYTYVAYRDGEREYYNRVRDPWELDNIYSSLPKSVVAKLNAQVAAMTSCRGASCWTASLPSYPTGGRT